MEVHEGKGMAITLGVLTLSGVVLLAGHIKTVALEKSLLEKQVAVFAERVTSAKDARKQVDETFAQREKQVRRAVATEAQYAGLLTDLLELSKVDPEARLVVQKWKIQSGSADAGASKTEVDPKAAGATENPAPSGKAKPGP